MSDHHVELYDFLSTYQLSDYDVDLPNPYVHSDNFYTGIELKIL